MQSLPNRQSTLWTVQPPSARTVVLAYNRGAGTKGSAYSIQQLRDRLKALDLEVLLETDLDRIVQRSSELWEARRLRTVIAAGGDGTAGLMANCLAESIPLTLYPLGTENLLARHFGMAGNPEETARTIVAGRTVSVDVGLANGKRFLVLASCGFDADVVSRLHQVRKGNINRLSYARPLLKSIGEYRYPQLRITADDQELTGRWAFVFNVPQYALQLPIVDDANCHDGQLDLCTFRQGNMVSGILYFLGVLIRRHRRWKDIEVRRCQNILIESDESVPYQLDGDPGGELPLRLSVLPGRLKMIVPEKWLRQQNIPSADDLGQANQSKEPA